MMTYHYQLCGQGILLSINIIKKYYDQGLSLLIDIIINEYHLEGIAL